MKNRILQIAQAVGVCAILGVSSLSAQVSRSVMTRVPFDFAVGDTQFRAGTYTVTTEAPQSAILIQAEQGGVAMFVLVHPAQAKEVQQQGKLVFHRYDDQYFLSKIWFQGSDRGHELMVSKVEEQIAQNAPKPEETTLLAARSKPQKPVR
jgi:hypothetical protein